MAIVANKDGAGITANGALGVVDRKYTTPNRNNAGSPVSSLVPAYTNELVLDTTNFILWRATGPANTDWMIDVLDIG